MQNGCGYNSAEEKFGVRDEEQFEALAEDKVGSAEEKFEVLAEEKLGLIAEKSEGSVDGELGAPVGHCELPPWPPLPDGGELDARLLEVGSMWLSKFCLPPSPEERAETSLAAQEGESNEEGDGQSDKVSSRQLGTCGLLRMVSEKLTRAKAKGSRTGAEEVLVSDQELPGPPPGLGCG